MTAEEDRKIIGKSRWHRRCWIHSHENPMLKTKKLWTDAGGNFGRRFYIGDFGGDDFALFGKG
jgi:hypothetical protein